MNARGRSAAFAAAGAISFVIIWEVGARFLHSSLLPPASDVLLRVAELVLAKQLWFDVGRTLFRWVSGFILGAVVGIPLGLVMGAYASFYRFVSFTLDFIGSLPVTAIFPLFLLLFGIGDSSKVAMVFTATVFVVATGAAFGVMHATHARVRMLRTFGATQWQTFHHVLIYEALPQIFVSLRSTLSIALIAVIVSEMFIGTEYGLGQRVYVAYQTNRAQDLYAALLVIGAIGYGSTHLFDAVQRRLIPWAGL